MGYDIYAYQNVEGEKPYNINRVKPEHEEKKASNPKDKRARLKDRLNKAQKQAKKKEQEKQAYKKSEKIEGLAKGLENYIGKDKEKQ